MNLLINRDEDKRFMVSEVLQEHEEMNDKQFTVYQIKDISVTCPGCSDTQVLKVYKLKSKLLICSICNTVFKLNMKLKFKL